MMALSNKKLSFNHVNEQMHLMGLIETLEGELTVVFDNKYIVMGGVCNHGLIPDYVWEREGSFIDEESQNMIETLEEKGEIEVRK